MTNNWKYILTLIICPQYTVWFMWNPNKEIIDYCLYIDTLH